MQRVLRWQPSLRIQTLKEEDLLGGDEINMCVAMDQLFQRMRNEGESIGIEKGRQEEKNKVLLKELLKVKLGTLSSPLEKQLTETSLEKLNELTLNIFLILIVKKMF